MATANKSIKETDGQDKTTPPNPAMGPGDPFALVPKTGKVTDRFGNTFHIGNAGDFWYPPFPIGADTDFRSHVRGIRDMDIRDDDILICSFPKTGLHWHQEMITQLRNNSSKLNPEGKDLVFLDGFPGAVVEKSPSPRMLVTHVPFRYIPRQALEKKIKIIYLVRNPKDTLVSYYNHLHNLRSVLHYPGTFEQFFYLYFECGYYYGDLFDYLMDFQNGMKQHPDVPFHISVYEEQKKNPIRGVERLNAFLGTGCDQQMCEDIVVACSFQKLKAFKDATMPAQLKALFRNEATAGFYRKGEVGDWKNWFTVSMNEFFEAEYNKRMADYDIKFTYTL